MKGSVLRFILLGLMAIISALGVVVVHVSVARAINPIGGALAATAAALMLGVILWIAGALSRSDGGPGRVETPSGRSVPRTR